MLCATAACGGEPASDPPEPVPGASSGVAGTAVVDEGCPVLEGTSPCPEVPLPARVVVVDAVTAGEVTAVRTDADGRFRIPLPPGSYQLRGENLTGAALPTALPVPVTVRAGEFTEAIVRFDSGVRGAPGT